MCQYFLYNFFKKFCKKCKFAFFLILWYNLVGENDMTEQIIIAIIGGLCVAIPSVLSTVFSNRKNFSLMSYKIEQLENKVSKHNNLIDRMYKVEMRVTLLEDEMKK